MASKISGLSPEHLRHLAELGRLQARINGVNWVATVKDVINYYLR
jgi:hypothetical protein